MEMISDEGFVYFLGRTAVKKVDNVLQMQSVSMFMFLESAVPPLETHLERM